MVFPKEVCYHLCSSTFTQMTNQYTRTLGVSSTQTTCVLRHRMHHLRRPSTLSEALDSIGDYYEKNHLRANPDKTQTCVFHLRNRKANRQLNISWCGKKLEHTPSPIYLGVTLDRTLSYSTHITVVKAKTAARNNVLRKLANSKWGTHPSTIKTTALALCYSTAEYACPVWERSAHAHKVDPVLNDACRAITRCLHPTNVENLYLLAGIAPPAVRRSVTAQREREKQVNDNRHPLHGHDLPRKQLHACHRRTDPEPIHSQIGAVVSAPAICTPQATINPK